MVAVTVLAMVVVIPMVVAGGDRQYDVELRFFLFASGLMFWFCNNLVGGRDICW